MSGGTGEPLNVMSLPLNGVRLIEASAGTGKTHTIGDIYARLVVDGGLKVDQILVLTFTQAATAELRARIRAKLQRIAAAFRGDIDEVDAFIDALRAASPDPAVALQRLEAAVAGFDEAAIHTIHAFCQRVLADWAFSSGLPFDTELLADESDLRAEIARDFWRREVYGASPLFVEYLLGNPATRTPEALLRLVASQIGKPFVELRGGEVTAALPISAFEAAFSAAAAAWRSQREEVADLLLSSKALNRTSYRLASIPKWIDELDRVLSGEPTLALGKAIPEKLTTAAIERGTKKNNPTPSHSFFELCEGLVARRDEIEAACRAARLALTRRMLEWCNAELEARKRKLRLQSHDDLLNRLRDALNGPDGELLAARLRGQYGAALIDEFQDTDPVQYEIFRRIYLGTGLPLYLVGDPKQAIYGFRGADVFAYLKARNDTAEPHRLGVNWRSEPALIEAVNACFSASPAPFLLDHIDFHSAAAADKARATLRIEGEASPPFVLWFLPRAESDGPMPKKGAGERAVAATADEIARLLRLGRTGAACFAEASAEAGRPLGGADIAVLVRTHRQARMVQVALRQRGIHSVEQANDSVYASEEADEMEQVLRAVAEPANERRVRTALATRLFGLSGEALFGLEEDEAGWEAHLQRFQDYHRLWREQGFFVMLRTLFEREQVARRLLAVDSGERAMTNLLHLAELLQTEAGRGRGAMELLVAWLRRRRHEAADGGAEEGTQLRLESDEQLVQILTIHRSKGLEFPVVFCPFPWDVNTREDVDTPIFYHDPAADDAAVLQFDPEDADARMLADIEARAEAARLFYVALTRAKNRCYMVWGAIKGAGKSAPAWLFHARRSAGPDKPAINDAGFVPLFESLADEAILADLNRISQHAAGAIAVAGLPPSEPARAWLPPIAAPILAARHFTTSIPRPWRTYSYSSMLRIAAEDRPDHDAVAGVAIEAEAMQPTGIFAFPRGARAGSCIHAIFENTDFNDRDPQALRRVVTEQLGRHGFDAQWTDTVATMVEDVLGTALLPAPGFRLDQISNGQRLNELEFFYPLKHFASRGLARLLAAAGADGELKRQVEDVELDLDSGYMKGYIDLVFEHDGRWYLADYKSNWLGAEVEDYAAARLPGEMTQASYGLQYLVYTVALHRYLRTRLPDYDYDRHVGGVFYLFVRGMRPDRGPSHGIFHDRLPASLIAAVDAHIAGADR